MKLNKILSIKNMMAVLGAVLVIHAVIQWTKEFVHEEFVSYEDLGVKNEQYKHVTEAWVSEPGIVERALLFSPYIPLHAQGFFEDRRYESKTGTLGVIDDKGAKAHCPRNLMFEKQKDGIQYQLNVKHKADFSRSEIEACLRKMMSLVAFKHNEAVQKAEMEKRLKEKEDQERKVNLKSWNT